MITRKRLDELDELSTKTQQEGYGADGEVYEDLDSIARDVPELTAEIRRCWAELGRGEQLGMLPVLTSSREVTWTS